MSYADRNRLKTLEVAFRTVARLKRPASDEQLAEFIGCSKRTAYRYIDAASLTFPVVKIEGAGAAKFVIMEQAQ